MKKGIYVLLFLVINIFASGDELEKKIKKLQEEKIIILTGHEVYISSIEWDKFSEKEKIEFLESINKYSRKNNKKNINSVKEIDTRKELARLGIFGVEIVKE